MKKRYDALGDRMKSYERIETEKRFRPNSFLYVRIDGRSFSKFTKGLNRPFDKRMSDLMIETTKHLVKETGARIGYTQSDEISLLIYNGYEEDSCIFDGKQQKLLSVIGSIASAYFNKKLPEFIPEKANSDLVPVFDARIFEVPDVMEAVNAFYWRELDCIKNSISMAAHDNFSHKELHKKNAKDMMDMLLNCKGISWEEYPDFFKYGTYVKRAKYTLIKEDMNIIRSKVDVCTGLHLKKLLNNHDKIKFIFFKNLVNLDDIPAPSLENVEYYFSDIHGEKIPSLGPMKYSQVIQMPREIFSKVRYVIAAQDGVEYYTPIHVYSYSYSMTDETFKLYK